jgi:uncharacterized HAD superfamily protein
MKKTLKVGFDLDGVILKNPLRNFRIFAKKLKVIKPYLFHQKKEPFYIPQTKIERFLWRMLHWSSYRIDESFPQIEKLIKEKRIEAYIITARFSFLKDDFESWIKKINRKKIFTGVYINKNNLQPDAFKIKMINRLNLDFFVEDNFDIVERLNRKAKAKIIWLSNFIDRAVPYPLKFFSLKDIGSFLEKKTKKII